MSSSSWTSPNAVPVNEVVSESTNDAGSGRPPSGDVTGANALETGSKMSPKNVDTATSKNTAEDRPNLTVAPALNSVKRLSEAVESLTVPEQQKRVILQLKEYQEQQLNLEEEYRKEWNLLKLKFSKQFNVLYVKRHTVLTDASQDSDLTAATAKTGTRNLPNFWLTALKSHILLAEMIMECDVPVLANLEDIVFVWLDPIEQGSFRLDFVFAPNEFFSNKVLSKTYHLERPIDDEESSVLTRTEGTVIKWLSPEKNVTERLITRRQRNRRTNQTRTITEVVEDNSFFNFFQSHEIPSDDQYDNLEENELTELEMIVEAEFEVGCILRDKIIPHALGWYLGIEKDDDAESLERSLNDNDGDFQNEAEHEDDDEDDDE